MTAPEQRDLGKGFEPFRSIDTVASKRVRFARLAEAVCKYDVSADLVKKIRAGTLIGRRDATNFLKIARRAIFDIDVGYSGILNEQVMPRGGRFLADIAITPVPFIPTNKGSWFLVIAIDRVHGDLKVVLAVPKLEYDGEERTVVATKHVCYNMVRRAKIRGSFVAFLAESITARKPDIWMSTSSGKPHPCLNIFDLDGNKIGYCPFEPVECALERFDHGKRFGKHLFDLQPRWRLNTFVNH